MRSSPSWRRDVDGPADLVEEVTRIVGYDQIPSTPLAARGRRGPADRDPVADDRAPGSPRRRGARARRGGDLELHLRSRGRAVRRRAACPRQSDQRRDEIYASVADPRPGCRGAAQCRSRRDQHPAVRGRPPLSGRCRDGRRSASCWPATRRTAQLAGRQGRRLRRVRRQGRGAGPARCGRRAGRQSAAQHGRGRNLASRPVGDAWAWARISLPHSASFIRGLPRALELPAGTVAAEIYLDAIPAPRSSERARPAFTPPALQAVKRDFAFIVPGDLAADALVRAVRGADKALITDARLFDRYEGDQGLSLAVEVTLQPGEKSFTDAEIGDVSTEDRRRGGEAGGAAQGVSGVDRGVNPRLDFVALQTGGNDFADLEMDRAGSLDESLVPQPARHRAQPGPPAARARGRGRRTPAEAAARRRTAPACLPGKMITGRPPATAALAWAIIARSALRPGLPIDADHAVAPGHPAEQRNGRSARASSPPPAQRAKWSVSTASIID